MVKVLWPLMTISALSLAACSSKPHGSLLLSEWPKVEKVFVVSTSFPSGESIPDRFSGYGGGYSPELNWTGLPSGTVTALLVCEDPDAPSDRPFVHWLLANIPIDVTEIPEYVAGQNFPVRGSVIGKNDSGSVGYFGPRPPSGDSAHHYHFQVIAVDKVLELKSGFTLDEARNALKGHVIGSGEYIGTYKRG